MKTQNTTDNTGVSFGIAIASIGRIDHHPALPTSAANQTRFEAGLPSSELADETTYWMIVAAAFGLQMLLVNLLRVL